MQLKPVSVAIAIAAMTACNRNQGPPPGAMAFPPAAVKVVPAAMTPVEDASEYVATLKSLRSTTIQPQIDGQITRLFVRSGERVAAGAPLVQIDPQRQQAAVSSQEAERSARQAAVTFAEQQQQRSAQLFTAGAISRQELEQAETALRTAQANLASLDAQVRQQQVQLRYYTVTAPTAGMVGDIPVRVGMQVSPQTLLTTIDANDTLEVYVSVPVERAGQLRAGLPLRILSGDTDEEAAATSVSFISPHVDDQTQSVLVKGTVKNPGGLRASQFVRARIIWQTAPGLVIPVTAVARINGQTFAFVADSAGGKPVAKQRAVKLGPIVGDNYAVLSGLALNDRVIVSGVQKLADGAPIQVE